MSSKVDSEIIQLFEQYKKNLKNKDLEDEDKRLNKLFKDNKLFKEIINKLHLNYPGFTNDDLKQELNSLFKKYKTIFIDQKIVRNWKKQLIAKNQQEFTYYLPVLNAVSDNNLKINDNIYFIHNSYLKNCNIQWDDHESQNYYDDYINLCPFLLAVRENGVGNEITLNAALNKGKLFTDLINVLNTSTLPCKLLLNTVPYTNRKDDLIVESMPLYQSKEGVGFYTTLRLRLPYKVSNREIDNFIFIFDDKNSSKNLQIKNAIKWLGESKLDNDIKGKFFKAMIALESIMEVDPKNNFGFSITEQISTMAAIIVEDDISKRKSIKIKIKKEYTNRSSLVHGENANISEDDYDFVFKLVRALIKNIVNNTLYQKYESIEDIWQKIVQQIILKDFDL